MRPNPPCAAPVIGFNTVSTQHPGEAQAFAGDANHPKPRFDPIRFVARPLARPYRAIRTIRYPYVRSLEGPWMLFDDGQDPYQMNNLAGKPEHAAVANDLEQRLQAQLKRIGDAFHPAEWYIL